MCLWTISNDSKFWFIEYEKRLIAPNSILRNKLSLQFQENNFVSEYIVHSQSKEVAWVNNELTLTVYKILFGA